MMTMPRPFAGLFARATAILFALHITPADSRPPSDSASPDDNQENLDGPANLDALRQLDPEAITRLHNLYFPAVFRYARYRLSDPQVAEDVAAEAFTRLLEHAHSGRGPRTSIRGWLMRTTANLVNDYYRVQYARPTEELTEFHPSDLPSPAAAAESSEEKHALAAALQTLTTEHQHVLALRFGSGLSLEATAEALDKKANAIKALQFRAVAALRRQMEMHV